MKTRKLLSMVLVLVMFTSLTLVFSANLANAQGDTYTVQYGDNLTSIAARFGVSVQSLAQANGIVNVNNIYAGQVLKLPTGNSAPTNPTPSTGQQAYIVQPGDTLTSVSAHFGVAIYDLAALNHLSVMSYLYIGQTLAIPTSASTAPTSATNTPAPATTTAAPTPTPTPKTSTTQAAASNNQTSYTVQSGDTLSAIATHFNSTVSAIVEANHIADPSMIFRGQVLLIPAANAGGGSESGTNPAPTPTAPGAHPIGTGKWIDVNLTTQKMVAYEGSTPVYSSLVSTGVASHPTVTGTFNIYVKYTSQAMRGGTPGVDYYYLPGVPYVMYFYQAYALHGTYWHHNFGHVMSHGCVNLPTPVAQWVFNWAPIGTPVNIHY